MPKIKDLQERTCVDCGVTGGDGLFYRRGNAGLDTRCKKCRNAKQSKEPCGTRVCTSCGKVGGAGEFGVGRMYKNGLLPNCKECHAIHQRRRKFKITEEELRELSEVHECEICGAAVAWHKKRSGGRRTPTGTVHIDHCHGTGRVRGVLCGPCNRAIGLFKDNPATLWKAIVYLQQNPAQNVAQ